MNVQKGVATATRAWGYARVSTEQQSDSGLSIDEQERKITARCAENNWSLEPYLIWKGRIYAAKWVTRKQNPSSHG
jgi:hypothetical protein